jgi:hypothetical protein
MLGNGSAGCRTTIIDRLPARGGHAHPSKPFPMLGRQNLIASTILTSASTLWTASRWALVFMTFGVSADPKVPIGPSRLNVTLHELFCRISDAPCKILSTSCSPSATTFEWRLTFNEYGLCALAGSDHISRPRHTIAIMPCIFTLVARGSSHFVPTLVLPRSSADPELIWTSIGCTCDAVSFSMPSGPLDALSGTLAAR